MILTDLKLSPPIFLAPMAGITDTPSREIAQLFNPGLVVSEMIASSEKDKKYFEKTVKNNLDYSVESKRSCPTAIQIAGCEVEWMCYAAQVIGNEGGQLVDINMGCPSKKVVGKLAGSALMREPSKALKLIESVVKVSNIPVTLKMRLGWDEHTINAVEIAKRAEECGVQMVTIHARTRSQFFSGKPKWELLKKIKEQLSIPLIVNGDILDVATATAALKHSNADGLMLGRGSIGKPWLIHEISASLYKIDSIKPIENDSLYNLIYNHLQHTVRFYGKEMGIRIFRKHLVGYLKHLDHSSDIKKSVLIEGSKAVLESKLKELFSYRKFKVSV